MLTEACLRICNTFVYHQLVRHNSWQEECLVQWQRGLHLNPLPTALPAPPQHAPAGPPPLQQRHNTSGMRPP